MICRFLEDNVCEALGIARVVHLTGIRQCGKTTLVESVALPHKIARSLDDAMQLRIASGQGVRGAAKDGDSPIFRSDDSRDG